MRKLFILTIIATTIMIFTSFKNRISENQKCDCRFIEESLKDISKIRVGMKRKDLDKIFSADGGISSINPQRFVYEKCGFIKVEVKFKFIDGDNKFPKYNPEDEIIEVSKPYLEHPFYD